MRPTHFDKCLEERHHLICTDVETCQLSFSSGGHNTFYYLGNSENRFIVAWDGDVFRQHDMRACLTPSFANVYIGCIGVGGQKHVAGAKSYATRRVCIYIVNDFIDGVVGCFCGQGLLLAELTECNEELVVNITSIEEKFTYDGLDAEYSFGIQGGAVVGASSVLDFGTV